jgi:hypothetical protein
LLEKVRQEMNSDSDESEVSSCSWVSHSLQIFHASQITISGLVVRSVKYCHRM